MTRYARQLEAKVEKLQEMLQREMRLRSGLPSPYAPASIAQPGPRCVRRRVRFPSLDIDTGHDTALVRKRCVNRPAAGGCIAATIRTVSCVMTEPVPSRADRTEALRQPSPPPPPRRSFVERVKSLSSGAALATVTDGSPAAAEV